MERRKATGNKHSDLILRTKSGPFHGGLSLCDLVTKQRLLPPGYPIRRMRLCGLGPDFECGTSLSFARQPFNGVGWACREAQIDSARKTELSGTASCHDPEVRVTNPLSLRPSDTYS
ncbi:hypothetical protein JCGZ_10796 [Jatropha curcas]|uniref:Uncharacterized protein n=1 Tax=Jatropha curcas TaxID=180498 RepID=A0A067KK81_JATCU|nr:hypothetical protein JCGZ_10796 [Jatropha curcas]